MSEPTLEELEEAWWREMELIGASFAAREFLKDVPRGALSPGEGFIPLGLEFNATLLIYDKDGKLKGSK